MNTIPDIARSEVEAQRREELIDAAITGTLESGPQREVFRRGAAPAPPPASLNSDGEAFFVFGNAIDGDGVPLARAR